MAAGPGALALGLAAGLSLGAQDLEPGPSPTREMFPLFLATMVYQPVDPAPLGRGRWRVDIDHMRANTFEFSDIFKGAAPGAPEGRIGITRESAEAMAATHAELPVLFYFDLEVARTTLKVRVGLSERTDAWAELPFISQGGGGLDSTIESFHNLGFKQFGRDRIRKDQLTVAVMAHGRLQFYSDQPMRGKTQDPTFGFTHRFLARPGLDLSLYAAVKPPLTTMYGVYRSGWDHGLGLAARWRVAPHHVLYGGVGVIRRPRGTLAFTTLPFGRMAGGWGGHGTWEYRRWKRLRPFVQLYAQSGFLPEQPYQELHRPSLQHDVGFRWLLHGNAALTFRYLNNITHNENTADMGLGLSLTAAF